MLSLQKGLSDLHITAKEIQFTMFKSVGIFKSIKQFRSSLELVLFCTFCGSRMFEANVFQFLYKFYS